MMNSLKYNYVVFNSVEGKMRLREHGYYTMCLRDLDNIEGIKPIYFPLQESPIFFRALYNIHNSGKINKKIDLPLKKLWWPYIFNDDFKTEKPLCFVFLARMPIKFVSYLKNRYRNSKTVLLFRDLRKVTDKHFPDYSDNPVFDLRFTIDREEAKKYNWIHFDEFESKPDITISSNYPESDVFFAGKAKDRLPRLIEAYDIFTSAGLKVKYYLTGVPEEDQVMCPGITYATKFMSYSEMLYHTVNSRCVLEINQKEAVGYTSRFLEAVMFNKRLITDNKDVLMSPFYNPKSIQYIKDVREINPDFILDPTPVNYGYNGEFSPLHLIEKIDRELVKRDAE